MGPSFATLTIGQAPRSDILPLLSGWLPQDRVSHYGLLDGLSVEQIAARYAPRPGDKVLVSRLLDGSQVRLSAAAVGQGLQQKIDQLEARGCETILLLCTGQFDGLRAQHAFLLEPDRLIPPLLAAMVAGHRLSVVVPVTEQIEQQFSKWRMMSESPLFTVASPYLGDAQEWICAAATLRRQQAEAVMLDCIGYTRAQREFLQDRLGVPVLLSNVLVAKLAAEFIH